MLRTKRAIGLVLALAVMAACTKRPVTFREEPVLDPATVTITNIVANIEAQLKPIDEEMLFLFASGVISRAQAKWYSGLSEKVKAADIVLGDALRKYAATPTPEFATAVTKALTAFTLAMEAILEYRAQINSKEANA